MSTTPPTFTPATGSEGRLGPPGRGAPITVLVLGATGTAGRSVVPKLAARGHRVIAHSRWPLGARGLVEPGIRASSARSEQVDDLVRLMAGVDAVIDVRVKIPPADRAARRSAWREYAFLRDVAAGRVVTAAIRAGVSTVVHDTVSLVYADGGDAWLTEDSPTRAHGALEANLAAERHLDRLTAHGGRGVALRFGSFYSDTDAFSLELVRAARAGRSLILGRPDAWSSALHVTDAGWALVTALTAPPGVYNVVDDEPMRRSDLVDLLARCAGRTDLRGTPAWMVGLAPEPVRALARSQRVSAARFRALGWQPSVPSRRQGWPDAFLGLAA